LSQITSSIKLKLIKGTPLRSGCLTYLNLSVYFLSKIWFSGCRRVNGITVYLVICILSVGNLFKTCNISVDLGKMLPRFSLFNRYILILNRVAKSIVDILRYHKIMFYTLNTLVTKHIGFRKSLPSWVTRADRSGNPLMWLFGAITWLVKIEM